MNGKERILAALACEPVDRVPTFEWFIDDKVGNALAGSGDILDVVESLDLDAVNVRPDYGQRPIADDMFIDDWGAKRKLTGDCLPALMEHPIGNIADHAAYEFPDPEAPGRFASLEAALDRFGDRRAVILNIRDGFSDVRDLLGYQEALMQFLLEPVLFGELLGRVVAYNLELARIAVRRFAIRIIATTDDVANASGLLFAPDKYFKTIGPAFEKVMAGYKDLGCLIIKHCDGDVRPLADFWVGAGIDCLDPIDPGGGLTMADMRARFGQGLCLKGNIDCAGALVDGTAEQVRQEVSRCIEQSGKTGLIVSSSNTIHQGVKPENFRAMLDAVREFG